MELDALRVVLVVGLAQTGKTTLAWSSLRRLTPRLLVLDPVRSRPLSQAIARGDARPCQTWSEAAAFLGSDSANGRWRIILRSPDEWDYWLALRAGECYRHVMVLADEAYTLLGHRPTLDRMVKFARANAHYGDGLGVPLWITAQRPMDLPPDIRSQASGCVSFWQGEPGDLDYLSKRFSPTFAETVAGLGKHQWAAHPADLGGLIRESAGRRHNGSSRDARGTRLHQGVSEAQSDPLRAASVAESLADQPHD